MYPTISFKRSLVYTAVLTALTVPFTKAVLAEEAVDPTKNSDIQLIQSNQSDVEDRTKADNLAYIRSEGQGGVVLKGADASGIVQQIMPELVNRGEPSDYLSNVLDLTINNDNVNSQNTFYISQIGGSWLVMNVDGENNTVRIADLAGIGFEKANAKDATTDDAQAPVEATKINITGDHNDLTLTPNTVGNIARKMQVTMDEGQGLSQYNVLNISYSDFSDIITKLKNASYSTIDVTQTDFTGDVDEVSNHPNIVFIDVVDADNTTVVLNQTGLGNNATLNVTNDFNTINLTQNNQIGALSNQADINVDGYNNTVTAEQTVGQYAYLDNKIDIDIINGDNNTISVIQDNGNVDFFEGTTATVHVSGSDNDIGITQTANHSYSGQQQITLKIQGDENDFMINHGFEWLDLTASVKGDGNHLTLENISDKSWADIWGSLNVMGDYNDLSARFNSGYVSFAQFDILGGGNTVVLGVGEGGMHYENVTIDGVLNTLRMDVFRSYSHLENLSMLGEENQIHIHNINSNLRLNTDILGNHNQFDLNIETFVDDYYWGGDNRINTSIQGSLNAVDVWIEQSDDVQDYYDQTINTTVSGLANRVRLHSSMSNLNTRSDLSYDLDLNGHHNVVLVDDHSANNVTLDFDVLGNDNRIEYTSDTEHSVDQTANIDVIGDHNRLLLNPSISNSTYTITGDDNYLSMTGHADELSSSIMSIHGNDNTIEMDVAGLDGAVNISFDGDNNVMGFTLGAGYLDYTLTGSDFIGAVKTVGSAYYQQIERLGTGVINMETAAGVINIASNCGQTCGNAI